MKYLILLTFSLSLNLLKSQDLTFPLLVEVNDTIEVAYRYHSFNKKDSIGVDTINILRFYYLQDSKKIYLNYSEKIYKDKRIGQDKPYSIIQSVSKLK
jgi:hypothetical protein